MSNKENTNEVRGTVSNVDIIPLGGLGEFGMNMMAIGYEDKYVIVDCGKMFPDEKHLGIDAIIPDFSFVKENKEKFIGLLLTHGHEDHIGAVPHLIREVDMPVWGTKLTLGLTRMRLKEFGLHTSTVLNEVKAGDDFDLDPFNIHFIPVTHGIPDSCSIAINTPEGAVIHTGDFKIDQTPLDEHHFDFQTFAEYGRKGVLALLMDSTNVHRPGYTFSERDVYDGFLHIFQKARGKILVASFASHMHRMQHIIDLAEDFGRKVAFVGRSMEQNSRLARELGYLEMPSGIEISWKDVKNQDPRNVVVIASGTQAEPRSALSRIARDQHQSVHLKPGDVVALSARKIPGNEKAISQIVDELTMRGAEVFQDGTLDIHVSGHGCREELKLMLSLTQPQHFVPVHGQYNQLKGNADLAREMGVPDESIIIALSGDKLEANRYEIRKTGSVEVGQVLVDSSDAEEIDLDAVQDRRILAQEGIVSPIVVVKVDNKPKVVNFHFLIKALSSSANVEEINEGIEDLVVKIVEDSKPKEIHDDELMKMRIGKAIRKHLVRALKIRPMILPVILTV